jgi:hypothetical protein
MQPVHFGITSPPKFKVTLQLLKVGQKLNGLALLVLISTACCDCSRISPKSDTSLEELSLTVSRNWTACSGRGSLLESSSPALLDNVEEIRRFLESLSE